MATVGIKGLIILTFLDCVRFSTNLAERYTTHLTPTCTVWIGVTRLHVTLLNLRYFQVLLSPLLRSLSALGPHKWWIRWIIITY